MNNGITSLCVLLVRFSSLRPTRSACGLVPRHTAVPSNICAFEVETQLKYKNTKFESSAKTPFLVFSWVYTSLTFHGNVRFNHPAGVQFWPSQVTLSYSTGLLGSNY